MNSAIYMALDPVDPDAALPTKRRRIPKGEMRKADIIRAALIIFARDGYAGSSLSNVAKVAGISQVGLLHHFPNKLALLRAVLEHRDLYVAAKLKEADQSPSLESFLSFLKLIMKFSIEDASVSQALMIINTESLSVTHPANQWFAERFGIIHHHLQIHLNLLIDTGEINSDVDVKQTSLEIAAMMDGMQIQWLRSPGQVQIEVAFSRFLQRLASDLVRR
jgi:AcrR family transcriptional regulator